MSIERTINPSLTINEVVERYPAVVGVFNARGLDTCCGGGLAVSEAARGHGLDRAKLLAALEQASTEADQ